jgi:hypothetical protein
MNLLSVHILPLVFVLFPGCLGITIPDDGKLLALLPYPQQMQNPVVCWDEDSGAYKQKYLLLSL